MLVSIYQEDKYRLKDVESNTFVNDILYDKVKIYDGLYGYVKMEGKYGLVNSKGQITPLIYDDVDFKGDGLAWVCINGDSSYVDIEGNPVDPACFEPEEKTAVSEYYCERKYGLLGKNGEKLTPAKYRYIRIFEKEGYALVQKGRSDIKCLYGIIDLDGREITQCKYTYIQPFHEGYALAFNGDFVRIDERTRLIRYKNKRYGFLDKVGNEIIPLIYDGASFFQSGLAAVKLGNLWGYIDKCGRFRIPLSFEEAGCFCEDMASVKIGGKYGFIDKTGMIKILPIYRSVSPFYNGGAIVRKGEKFGVVDKNGVEIVPVIYDSILRMTVGSDYYIVWLEEKCGLLDAHFRFYAKAEYDNAGLLYEKFPYVIQDGVAYLVYSDGELNELGDISSHDPLDALPF